MTEIETFSLSGKKVWVAGHRGMVGSALCRRLNSEDCNVLTASRAEVDLRDQAEVRQWVKAQAPEVVFVAAAKVGGIVANDSMPAQFLYDNLMIEANLIHAAFEIGVQKLIFLGSSCIYPRLAEQPMSEATLLTGPLEETNQWYAVAKIAGIKLCQAYRKEYGCNYISAMPTNLYGTEDNFDLETSHVVPALMAKMHTAKVSNQSSVTVWGTGTPKRELLFVDDCADALVHLAKTYCGAEHVHVGTGEDLSISEIAYTIADVVGFEGELTFDRSRPDGTPRKLLDTQKLAELGWRSETSLKDGLTATYEWYLSHRS